MNRHEEIKCEKADYLAIKSLISNMTREKSLKMYTLYAKGGKENTYKTMFPMYPKI